MRPPPAGNNTPETLRSCGRTRRVVNACSVGIGIINISYCDCERMSDQPNGSNPDCLLTRLLVTCFIGMLDVICLIEMESTKIAEVRNIIDDQLQ